MILTRLRVDGAARLAALHAACFAEGWSAPSIATLLNGPGAFAIVGSDDGIDAGFALLQSVPPEAELLSVGVVPHLRLRGVGALVLRHAAAELHANGVETMFLDVADDNGAALALYRRLGFREISRRRLYYEGRTDAIVMKAALTDIIA